MNKLIVILLVIILIPQTLLAVCLEGNPSVSEEYAKRSNIVIGKVVKIEDVPELGKYYEGQNYTVEIIETINGNLNGVVRIFSENSSGRFPMDLGKNYILFLYEEPGLLQVDNCGNSGELPEKQGVANEVRNLAKAK